MKTIPARFLIGTMLAVGITAHGQSISLETSPPIVVKTVPVAGAAEVDPALAEIKVTFSKAMQDGSWSWSTWGEENYPETTGKPHYLGDARTCVLPVKLQPNKFYAIWLNSDKFRNFTDPGGRTAVPYLLAFRTAPNGGATAKVAAEQAATATDASLSLLNEDQRAVLAWTDRQFRSFFDNRTFEGWSETERAELEAKSIDALKGPRSQDYYRAINTLGALHSIKALPALRGIAFERVDRNNRDRWMAIRSLGLIADKTDVPELIRLVYHGNVNTRWWAQISLVRITGKNFGKDWNAWSTWWNEQKFPPPYNPEIVRWWDGQPEPDKLAQSLEESDQKFLADLKGKSASAPKSSPDELVARLKAAEPTMKGIRENWTATATALNNGDTATALAAAQQLTPYIKEFLDQFRGTSLEAGTTKALALIKSLTVALEKDDQDAVQTTRSAMATLGRSMEEQIKSLAEAAKPISDSKP
ncbi:MAG: Ig-like domain-containing protein [Verrucomicrobiota bacterium]